jgi:putative hemolysin
VIRTHRWTSVLLLPLVAAMISSCGGRKPPPGGGGGFMTNPAASHCVQTGGHLANRPSPQGPVAFCMFRDGTECEQWAYYERRCGPGQFRSQLEY